MPMILHGSALVTSINDLEIKLAFFFGGLAKAAPNFIAVIAVDPSFAHVVVLLKPAAHEVQAQLTFPC
jgi:hypothetical protein